MPNLFKLFSRINLSFFELLTEKPFSVRDLAEKSNCSPAKVSQAVHLFEENDLVLIEKFKNRKIVSLNRNNAIVKEIISLIFIHKILNSSSFKKLKKLSKSIGIYGSIANGTADSLSDVDLWVVSKEKLSLFSVGDIKKSFEKELGREVSLKSFVEKELIHLRNSDKIFFNELKNSKILFGEFV